MLVELTLGASRRAEETFGPGAAVRVAAATVETLDAEVRRTLLLAGLGAAVRAGDTEAFASFAALWAASGDEPDLRALSTVARLVEAGEIELARRLARAELERAPTAAARFVLASTIEESEPARARELYLEAVGGDPALAARARVAALSLEGADAHEEALAAIDAGADAATTLRLAEIALASPRLYARTRVLDRLRELALEPAHRAVALRIALAHADRCGAGLGALERDRITEIARVASADAEILQALAGQARPAVPVELARAALAGQAPTTELPDRAAMLGLRAIAGAVRDESATLLLSALAAHPPSPLGWSAVVLGLRSAPSREGALACAERWVEKGIAPPGGFLALAGELAALEEPRLAERAMAEAVRAHERDARTHLGIALERRAHAAYAAADLPLAKSLLERSLRVDPERAAETTTSRGPDRP